MYQGWNIRVLGDERHVLTAAGQEKWRAPWGIQKDYARRNCALCISAKWTAFGYPHRGQLQVFVEV